MSKREELRVVGEWVTLTKHHGHEKRSRRVPENKEVLSFFVREGTNPSHCSSMLPSFLVHQGRRSSFEESTKETLREWHRHLLTNIFYRRFVLAMNLWHKRIIHVRLVGRGDLEFIGVNIWLRRLVESPWKFIKKFVFFQVWEYKRKCNCENYLFIYFGSAILNLVFWVYYHDQRSESLLVSNFMEIHRFIEFKKNFGWHIGAAILIFVFLMINCIQRLEKSLTFMELNWTFIEIDWNIGFFKILVTILDLPFWIFIFWPQNWSVERDFYKINEFEEFFKNFRRHIWSTILSLQF